MSQRSTSTGKLEFRGISERNINDQMAALAAGYSSVEQYAIDQLAQMYHELDVRVKALEGGEIAALDDEG